MRVCVCEGARACVRVCVCVSVRARVLACVCVCVCVFSVLRKRSLLTVYWCGNSEAPPSADFFLGENGALKKRCFDTTVIINELNLAGQRTEP